MAVVVHVGIVQHDLAAVAQQPAPVRLAFHEAVDEAAIEVFRTRALGKFEAGIADRVIYAVHVERVFHDGMTNPVAPAKPKPAYSTPLCRYIAWQKSLAVQEMLLADPILKVPLRNEGE